jgi:hypothetical protein
MPSKWERDREREANNKFDSVYGSKKGSEESRYNVGGKRRK